MGSSATGGGARSGSGAERRIGFRLIHRGGHRDNAIDGCCVRVLLLARVRGRGQRLAVLDGLLRGSNQPNRGGLDLEVFSRQPDVLRKSVTKLFDELFDIGLCLAGTSLGTELPNPIVSETWHDNLA
jgi:hypothetical protein